MKPLSILTAGICLAVSLLAATGCGASRRSSETESNNKDSTAVSTSLSEERSEAIRVDTSRTDSSTIIITEIEFADDTLDGGGIIINDAARGGAVDLRRVRRIKRTELRNKTDRRGAVEAARVSSTVQATDSVRTASSSAFSSETRLREGSGAPCMAIAALLAFALIMGVYIRRRMNGG